MKGRKEPISEHADRMDQYRLSREEMTFVLSARLSHGLPFTFVATGASMEPAILDGDLVTVSPLNGQAPEMGEVVALVRMQTGAVVVHRVVAKGEDGYFIKGDNPVGTTDQGVKLENILGRVTRVERDGAVIWQLRDKSAEEHDEG